VDLSIRTATRMKECSLYGKSKGTLRTVNDIVLVKGMLPVADREKVLKRVSILFCFG
jgi:hypothetical protein